MMSILIILSIIKISIILSDPVKVSDLVQPQEFCTDKQECNNIGCGGHLDCISNVCSCVNNSKYMKDIYTFTNGCYWNITFGHPCRFNNDCATDGSICSANRFGCNKYNEDKIKTCQCPSNKEYVDGICQHVLTRLNGTKCCNHNDCNTNFECHLNTNFAFGQCKCRADYALYKDQCISLQETKICSHDIDCPEDFFCIKQTSEHGTCREINMIAPRVHCKETPDCKKLGYFGHVECQNNYCLCTNSSKQIHLGNAQGCYMKSYYGQKCLYQHDCQSDLECVHQNDYYGICQCPRNMILYLNKCVDMPENKYGSFCESNAECNATGLYCYKNNSLHGRCQCNIGLFNFEEKCIEMQELGLCSDNGDCPRIEYCNKTADNVLFGQCSRIKIPETYYRLNNDDFKTISDEPNSARVNKILLVCILVLFIIIVIILSRIVFIRGYSCRNIFCGNRKFGTYASPDQYDHIQK